jgi:VWA domain-containing protein/aerotolerance regulator-like protein
VTSFAVFSPALAAGAAIAAVGVPLVIHLLFRKRYQIVPWAAIRFLLVAERRHRRRIDQWLLLALRALALVLPLFAMVATTRWAESLWQAIRPGTIETIANVPRTHHVVVLDASLSMTARADDGPSRFEKAVAQAENMIRSGSPGDGYTLIVLTGGAQTIVRGPANDPERVVAELRKVKPTHGAAEVAAALASVSDVLTQSPRAYPRKQVTFFTDLQRSAWASALAKPDSVQPPEVWQRIFDRADVVVVDVARSDLENRAVGDVSLSDPLPMIDTPVAVDATIANLGRSEKRNVRVQLLLVRPSSGSETPTPVEEMRIDTIPSGGRVRVRFGQEAPIRFREKGLHVFQVRLTEPDDLPADDVRSLAVQVRDGLHTILVEGGTETDPLRRGAGYLADALFPLHAKPGDSPARLKRVTPSEFLAPTSGDLIGVDCVVLCDYPLPNSELAAKLEGLLRRGTSIVIGLGPQAAAGRADYNRVLYADGNGILPGRLGEVVSAASSDDPGFRLAAEEEAYRRPPLQFFQGEKHRAGLITAPFHTYLRLDLPPDGRARTLLSFVPAKPAADVEARKPDPAIVEMTRHRGKVVVFASSFNKDWNEWATDLGHTYLPFQHELLRYVATNPERHTLPVGNPIEEFYPPIAVGQTAALAGPESITASLTLSMQEEAGAVKFEETRLSGLYRIRVEGQPDSVFAVNAPEIGPGSGSESDLRQFDRAELRTLGPAQLVEDASEARPSTASGAALTTDPKPHGPAIARLSVLLALAILALEMFLAWRWGPARTTGAGSASGSARVVQRKLYLRFISTAAALVPLAAAIAILFVLVHYERTGDLLGFVPEQTRQRIEATAGVPAAQPGEGTKWRLESFTAFVRNAVVDRRLVLGLAVAGGILALVLYRMERPAVSGFGRLVVPTLLRTAILLVVLFVLLAQLRLAFDREGWPEVVVLIDTSASMGHADDLKDPSVRARAEELAALLARDADLAGRIPLTKPERVLLARTLLTHKKGEWLLRLLKEKEVRVHIRAVDSAIRPVATLEEERDVETGRRRIDDELIVDKVGGEWQRRPLGNESRLGEGVERILKDFRGSSLAAIIMFTDGVTTAGDNLRDAAREASRAGVPLFLVGLGDAWETPDLILTDLQAEDTITVGDRLVFDARLAAHGRVPPEPLPVILSEKVGGQLIERGRVTVTPDLAGNRVPITISHTPLDAGEKTFVLAVPTVAGETEVTNNRIERTILVTDSKRVRVLFIEGYPRYDFRFVKVLLERESERSVGGKGIEVKVILLNAAKGWEGTDRSALGADALPTREELFGYDVIVLGDVDPKQLPRGNRALTDLADFVRVKGGGLLFLSGEHGTPSVYFDTPLADVLPVQPGGAGTMRADSAAAPVDGFRPRITPAGRQHPLFRFSPDEAEAAAIWNRLQPLFWSAQGYRRKPHAVVLAVHPDRSAEGGNAGELHPLVLQAFAGAGPVLFLGLDDTWRWRFRNDEEHFDRFWIQAVRVLSRSRIRRVELKIAPKSEFRRDEKMTVFVRFPVEAPAPPAGQPVRVTMTRGPLPNRDGTPGTGRTETTTLTLARVQGPGMQYETVLTRTPEGEYRFTLAEPEPQPGQSAATALARVLPPLDETERLELNVPDLAAAATISNGGFYTLATADKLFDDLKKPERVRLNEPCAPIELWNQPVVYVLVVLLFAAEWLLRKRERLL